MASALVASVSRYRLGKDLWGYMWRANVMRGLCAMITTCFCMCSGVDALDKRLLNDILATWQARQDGVTSFRATWEEESSNGGGGKEPRSIEFIISEASNYKLINRHQPKGETTQQPLSPNMVSSFNNVSNYHFSEKMRDNSDDWPRGIVWKDTEYDELHGCQIRPWLLQFRPFGENVPGIRADNVEIVAESVMQRGHECCVIKHTPEPGVAFTNTYWSDKTQQYSVVRFVEEVNGRPTMEMNIDYVSIEGVGWVPNKWDAGFVNGRYSVAAQMTSFEPNIDTKSDVFTIDFPAGTVVFDRDSGKRWLVRPDGSKRIITQEETSTGFNYTELFDTEAGELAPTAHGGAQISSPWKIILLFVNLIVVIFLIVVYFRKQRRITQQPHDEQ